MRSETDLRLASVGGFSLAFRDEGSGVACFFIHGFPFDHRQWRGQWSDPDLAGAARWVVPDLRGHGASDAPHPPYRIDDFAEDLRVLLDSLDIDRCVLGGLSMGGYIALAFARRYPERLAGLALMATRATADSEETRRVRFENAARVRREGVAAIAGDQAARILGARPVAPAVSELVLAMIRGTSTDGFAGSLEAMATRADATDMLPSLRCPALVVAGADDHLVAPDEMEAIAGALPASEFLVVPAAGHLVPLEQPAAVNRALHTLLERCRGSR